MRYLLDTNIFISWFGRRNRAVIDLLKQYDGQFGISSIVLFELYFGAFNSSRVSENLDRLGDIDVPVVEFDKGDAIAAGEIRAFLKPLGRPIGPYDILIAGQAKARGLVMVTANMKEFARVPGLALEDWTGE